MKAVPEKRDIPDVILSGLLEGSRNMKGVAIDNNVIGIIIN